MICSIAARMPPGAMRVTSVCACAAEALAAPITNTAAAYIRFMRLFPGFHCLPGKRSRQKIEQLQPDSVRIRHIGDARFGGAGAWVRYRDAALSEGGNRVA